MTLKGIIFLNFNLMVSYGWMTIKFRLEKPEYFFVYILFTINIHMFIRKSST